jgi:TusA-related sulfurtransferase
VQYPFFSGKEEKAGMEVSADYFLDVTTEVCPLTFVRTKLFVERMVPGRTLEIRLNAGEPLANVPRSLSEMGCEILSISQEDTERADGAHRVLIRWGGKRGDFGPKTD